MVGEDGKFDFFFKYPKNSGTTLELHSVRNLLKKNIVLKVITSDVVRSKIRKYQQ